MNDSENSYENGNLNSNFFENSEPIPIPALDFNEVEDVCHGVKRYWRYLLLSIIVNVTLPVIFVLLLFCFPQLAIIIIFAGIILFSPQPINEPISFSKAAPSFGDRFPDLLVLEQMSPEQALQWGRLVFLAIYLAIFAFYGLCLCIPMYKSMVKLYKTPECVCPNARRFLNASWFLYGIGFCVSGFAVYFIDTSYRNLLWTTALSLNLSSLIVFYSFMNRIGARLLPESKECRIAIILLLIELVCGDALILFFNYLPSGMIAVRLSSLINIVTAGASILFLVYVFQLQRRCSEILQTGTFTIPVPQSPEVQPRSVLRTGFDKLKSIRNLRLIILITICVLLLGATVYYTYAYPFEGQKINWSWSSFFSPKREQSPYQEIQNWNDAVYKLNHGDISKEFFVRWVYMTYLPDLESKYRSDTSEKLKEEYFRNGILKEKIDCCMTFRKALKQDSPEALQQAIENVYRIDFKELKAEQENGWRHKVCLTTNDALLLAVSMDELDMAQWLVSAGADVNYKNRDDKTPLQIAKDKNNQRMVEFLLNNGAVDSNK
ncbi:MAG: ankyrin repeat domain-containing protein [Thermoguttaceae bacterium]|nr:ankyrin repeat domain-containing protein [Thermoguttaceae bacterium]